MPPALGQEFRHIVPYRAQGRAYRLALDGRSMRKIKAAEAETTSPVDEMAERDDDTERTDKRWQTMHVRAMPLAPPTTDALDAPQQWS